MEERYLEVLYSCPLFRGTTALEMASALKRCGAVTVNFSAKEEISCMEEGLGRLGILISGEIKVCSPGEKETVLNHLGPGDIFGVSAFFGSGGAETRILTQKECVILFIREDRAEPLWENRVMRKNLISFLTDRICFLSRKIAAFTEGSAKSTLCRHLLQKADECGCCKIENSYSALAKELNLGRASLYRSLDELTLEGLIKKEKKEILLLNKDALNMYL